MITGNAKSSLSFDDIIRVNGHLFQRKKVRPDLSNAGQLNQKWVTEKEKSHVSNENIPHQTRVFFRVYQKFPLFGGNMSIRRWAKKQ